jgi:hypothetical protein
MRTGLQKRFGQASTRIDQVLAVVQHEEQVTLAQ